MQCLTSRAIVSPHSKHVRKPRSNLSLLNSSPQHAQRGVIRVFYTLLAPLVNSFDLLQMDPLDITHKRHLHGFRVRVSLPEHDAPRARAYDLSHAQYTWRCCAIHRVYVIDIPTLNQRILFSMNCFTQMKALTRWRRRPCTWLIRTMHCAAAYAIVPCS